MRAYAASLFLGVVADSRVVSVDAELRLDLEAENDAGLASTASISTRHAASLSSFCRSPAPCSSCSRAGAATTRARAARARARARRVAASSSPRRSCLWWRFNPTSADFQFVERHAWMPAVRHPVPPRRRRHQPVADRPHRLPDAAGAAVLVGVGAQERQGCSRSSCSRSRRAMLGVFVSIDLFLFYIFWDAMLIPMYFLIGIWGYERRIYAAVKFILYTMAGSVLMLIAIIGLAWAHADGDRVAELRPARSLRRCELPPQMQNVVLPRLRAGVPHQGAAVPVPHLAARRARRGADRRLGHPGRRDAEDGHLRPAAVRLPALSGRRRDYFAP